MLKRIPLIGCLFISIVFSSSFLLRAEKEHPVMPDMPIEEEDVDSGAKKRSTRLALPETYDLREEGKITSVKDQGSTDTCWAFTSLGAIEADISGASADLSENHLAYYFYDDQEDPLGLTSSDRNVPQNDYLSNGGNIRQAALSLSSWIGPATEESFPFRADLSARKERFTHDYVLKDASFLTYDVAELKKMIYSGLPVGVMFDYEEEALNDQTFGYYLDSDAATVNHAVLLVGWDDTYSAGNFTDTPSADGAWIAKNSWGSDFGDSGYIYISYYEPTLSSCCTYTVEDASLYDFNYHYDGSSMSGYRTCHTGVKVANIFTVSGSRAEELRAVSVVNYTKNIGYTLQIYKLSEGQMPEEGTPLLDDPLTGALMEAGIHTIHLDAPVKLKKGDIFSVVFTYEAPSDIRVGLCSSRDIGWVKFTEHVESGQSYLFEDGTWKDLVSISGCARIKAFTKAVDPDPLSSVSNLRASSGGPNRVVLSWEDDQDVDGWLIYGIKDCTYGYVGMSRTGMSFSDLNALDTNYNFYWVFPYVVNSSGVYTVGPCDKYAYAKGICPPVSNPKAEKTPSGVKISWDKVYKAEGYLIYGITPGKSYSFIGMTTKGTSFIDKSNKGDGCFYWVFAYHKNLSGKMVPGRVSICLRPL